MKSKGWFPFAVVALRFPTPLPAHWWAHSTAVAEGQIVCEMVIHMFEHVIEIVSEAA
jgi:hypothetical protein